MLVTSLFLASAAVVAAQSSSSITSSITSSAQSSQATPSATKEPCASVASLAAKSTEFADVPIKAVYDCLESVPVDVDGNKKLIDELKVVWPWHSEYGYLKNLPKDIEISSLNVEDELNNIQANLDKYSSEYEVQLALQNITTNSRNYHWNYSPDILQVFGFSRPFGVASISSDGKSLPKLYVESDVAELSSSKSKVSEIKEINGEEAYAYLQRWGAMEQYLDGDGRLNTQLKKGDTDNSGSFSSPTIYPGPTTKVKFANGTEQEQNNTAWISAAKPDDFKGVKDGKTFFDKFCKGMLIKRSNKAEEEDSEKSTRPNMHPGRPGAPTEIPQSYHLGKRQIPSDDSNYPDAVVMANSSAVAGYFLNNEDYKDVAILKIITFEPDSKKDDTGVNFQATIKKFLQKCVDAKKKKLIIDLRENGGGLTHLLFDAFIQLFPKDLPFSGQRYRATDQFLTIGDSVNDIFNNIDLYKAYQSTFGDDLNFKFRLWAYWDFTNAKGENFKDWKEFEGPNTNNGDLYTTTFRYNYSNSNLNSVLVSGFNFNINPNQTQAFAAENIVMFTDGLCGSACASFHEELKNIGGVKSVVVGGRPENKPMQAVSGTKGGEVISSSDLPKNGQDILNVTASISATEIKNDNIKALANVQQILTRAGDGGTRVQTQDQIRKGDVNATPLQYIYEAADCRIFYTADSYANPQSAWRQALDAFQDDKKCVDGSTKHSSSISGGFKPFGPGDLKDENLPQQGGASSAAPSATPTPTVAPSGTPAASASPSTTPSGAAASLRGSGAAFAVGVAAAAALL